MNISASDWKRLFALLDSALELGEHERELWLERLDGDALQLKDQLRALLTQHAQVNTDQFMKNPYAPSDSSPPAEQPFTAVSTQETGDAPTLISPATQHATTILRHTPQADTQPTVAALALWTQATQLASKVSSSLLTEPSKPQDLASINVGSVLKNRFVLVEELGSGGMGRVFKARDRVPEAYDDRQLFLAVKVISQEFSRHPDSFKALQREAKRARGLTHENVVKVYDFDQDGECVYMTMEYLEGRTLQSYLKEECKNGLPPEKAWPFIRAIGAALEHGHEKRIVHSDLKPGNVFICRDGTVKVLDFGISRPLRALEEGAEETVFDPTKRLGGLTPAYASLEMWNFEAPDPSDDVYAFACLTYELLTGKHPYSRCSAKQAFEGRMVPQRVQSLRRPQWEALKRGLAFRRDDRTPRVRELVAALAPSTALKRHAPFIIGSAVMVGLLAIGIGTYYYGVAVEDSTLEVLQCAAPPAAEPARPSRSSNLTPQQTRDISDSLALARDYLNDAKLEMSVADLKYILSEGANNINQIADGILTIDPANKDARQLKSGIADLYAAKAKTLQASGDHSQALEVTREARKVLPSSQTLFRLEQSLCRANTTRASKP